MSLNPVKSIATTGSSPTTHALLPGGIIAVSPGPNSSSEPSSITTLILPDTIYCVCGSSQLLVLTIGLTHFSQLHPGSSVILPIVVPFVKVVNSSLPLSNVLTSSGELIDFFSIGAALAVGVRVDILLLIISWVRYMHYYIIYIFSYLTISDVLAANFSFW